MQNYQLDNYILSKHEIFQSLVISEYGLRHLSQSKQETLYKWGHKIIALIELCPIIGLIVTIFEALIVKYIQSRNIYTQCQTNNEIPIQIHQQEPLQISHPPPSSINKETPLQINPWLFRGTQQGCEGPVCISKAESVRATLDSHSSDLGIRFNQKMITDSIKEGTCTAMSLEFLDSYFKTKKLSIERPDAQAHVLVDRLIELGELFAKSSQEMRDRQAAYNTIEVMDSLDETVDHSKNKIQALANYHSFNIDYSSSEIDVAKLANKNELSKELDALPEGTFFIRILKPADNKKLEEKGHSLIYIKENGLGLFYDPNFGLRSLPSEEHAQILFQGFKNNFQLFGINKARFYRLQPQQVPEIK